MAEGRERQSDWPPEAAGRNAGDVPGQAPEAFEVLCKQLNASDPKVSGTAAREILDRAYGRPVQSINASISEDGGPVRYYAEVPKPAKTTEEWVAGNPVTRPDATH